MAGEYPMESTQKNWRTSEPPNQRLLANFDSQSESQLKSRYVYWILINSLASLQV